MMKKKKYNDFIFEQKLPQSIYIEHLKMIFNLQMIKSDKFNKSKKKPKLLLIIFYIVLEVSNFI